MIKYNSMVLYSSQCRSASAQNAELYKNYTGFVSFHLWFILLGNFSPLKGLEKYFFLKK